MNKLAMLVIGALVSCGTLSGCDPNGTPTTTTAESTSATPPTGAGNQATPPTQLTGTVQGTPNALTPTRNPSTPSTTTTQSQQPSASPGQAAAPDMDAPPIRFEPPSMEFGLMSPGEEKTGTMSIRNLGTTPLLIVGSRSSCKCTAVDLANTVIEPGQAVSFSATMKPDISPGPKKAQVRVAFEGYGQIASVDIHAEVVLAVRSEPAYIVATEGNPLFGELTLSSLDGQPFKILAANREEPRYVDFDPAKDAPRSQYRIRYDLTVYNPDNCEEWPGWFIVETDHAGAPIVDLRIRHLCTIPERPGNRRWLTLYQRELLGVLQPGQPVEFVIPLIWAPHAPKTDLVNAVATSSKEFSIELLGTDYSLDDPEIKVRLTPRSEHRGLLYGVIELHSTMGHKAKYYVAGRVVPLGP